MAQLFKSVKRLERHKKDKFVFTNNGVAMQAKFLTTVQDWDPRGVADEVGGRVWTAAQLTEGRT